MTSLLIKKKYKGLLTVARRPVEHEILWVKLAGTGNTPDLYICTLYCPHAGYPVVKRRAFYNDLLDSCSTYAAIGEVLLLGDFNARVGNISGDHASNENGPLLFEFLQTAFADGEHGAYHCLLNPTFGHSGCPTFRARGQTSIVDYMITSRESLHHVQSVHVENNLQKRGANGIGSDHNLLYVDWKRHVDMPEYATVSRTMWKLEELENPAHQTLYQAALRAQFDKSHHTCVSAHQILEGDAGEHGGTRSLMDRQAALDIYYHTFLECIQRSLADSIAVKTVSPHSRMFWDAELSDLTRLRNQAYQEACASEIASPTEFPRYWQKYNELRKQVHALASSKRDAKYQALLTCMDTQFINDRRHFFREMVKLRKGASDATQLHALRDHQRTANSSTTRGVVTSKPEEIKHILFDFYSALGIHNPTDPNFDIAHLQSVEDAIKNVQSSESGPTFCETRISEDEVALAMSALKNHKASGLDNIPNEALKHGGEPLKSAMTILFNTILNSGLGPSIWKQAMVLPIFKEGGLDPLEASSYRPISLTSCISKVYERVLLNRITDSLEVNALLPEEQAGFRKNRSTLEQAYILREILDSRKPRSATFASFIDLTNAFGSTWQDGMWFRLRESGVKGKLYNSIRSLYENCRSAIQTPYGLTEWFTSDLGTRQGAVLSPLLFSLLINPLANLLKRKGFGVRLGNIHIACLLYADDLVLIADWEQQLRDMLDEATKFFRQWRFKVSARKSQVVAFSPGETRTLRDRQWSLGGEIIHDVQHYKYLGLMFEKGGRWFKMQASNVDKARHASHQLYQIGFGDAGLQIGQSAFLWSLLAKPKLLYGVEIWSPNSHTSLMELEQAQAQAAKRAHLEKRTMPRS